MSKNLSSSELIKIEQQKQLARLELQRQKELRKLKEERIESVERTLNRIIQEQKNKIDMRRKMATYPTIFRRINGKLALNPKLIEFIKKNNGKFEEEIKKDDEPLIYKEQKRGIANKKRFSRLSNRLLFRAEILTQLVPTLAENLLKRKARIK